MMIDSCALSARALLSVLKSRAELREQDTDEMINEYDDEQVDFAGGERPSGWDAECERSYQASRRFDYDDESSECPEHGAQQLRGPGYATRGADPYHVEQLACGCDVVWFDLGAAQIIKRAAK